MQELQDLLSSEELGFLVDRVKHSLRPLPPPGAQAPFLSALTGGRSFDQRERILLEATTALQALQARRNILAEALPVRDVAKLLGRTRQTVHDKVKNNTLLAIDDGGRLQFPAWQFDGNDPKGVVPGLPKVLAELRVPPMVKANWLRCPNPYFKERTPLDALKAGDVDRVVAEARRVGVL